MPEIKVEPAYEPGSKRTEKFVTKAMKRLKTGVDSDAHNRKDGIEDLKFINGEQWDEREKKRRAADFRPCLQSNLLTKFVDQVTGDARHNRPGIKIRPVGNKADHALAEIRMGIVRNIEYQSDADQIYDQAMEMAVSCGYGAWRVLTRYCDSNPFQQEIYLESIPNPFLVYLDPNAKSQVGADAKWAFILEKMPKSVFQDRWPKANVPTSQLKWGKGVDQQNWFDKDTVTVAEYFVVDTVKVKMHLLEDGSIVTDEEYEKMLKEYDESVDEQLKMIGAKMGQLVEDPASIVKEVQQKAQPQPGPSAAPGGGPILGEPKPAPPQAAGQPGGAPPQAAPAQAPQGQPGAPQPGAGQPQNPQAQQLMQAQQAQQNAETRIPRIGRPKSLQSSEADKTIVKRYLVTACEVLEGPSVIAGKYIPICMVYGRERNIEGKRYIRSLIRDGKDPQKMYNYSLTAAAEVVGLQPKAPWLGTAKQFKGYEEDYASANVSNQPFLMYNGDPDANGPPTRQPPGQVPVALFQQMQSAKEDLKDVIGMYNADLGNFGSEQTGKAVLNKQKPGDIGTFCFINNLCRTVAHCGKIIVEMIPTIYDTERDMRLRNIDDSETWIPVNTTAANALKMVKENPERYVGLDIKRLTKAIRQFGPDAKFNDLTVGTYDVVAQAGPSYATARQESQDIMLNLLQAMPQQMQNTLDILFRSMDFKDAPELAKRFRKMIPGHLLELKEGEDPPPQAPMPPQVQLAMAKVKVEEGKARLEMLKSKQEELKLQHEQIKMQIEMMKYQNSQQGVQEGPDLYEIVERMARLMMEQKRLDFEQRKFDHQMGVDLARHEHEVSRTIEDADIRREEIRSRNNASRD